jgi:AraC-like DNA-binding protein
MNKKPLISIALAESLTSPLPKEGEMIHWDGNSGVSHEERSLALSTPGGSSSFQVNGPLSASRTHPYVTTSDIGLVPSGTLQKIVWEQEARLFTVALDPILFAGIRYEGISRVSGELVWEACQDQPASFSCSVHPVLLVHSFNDTCPVERVAVVPHLREQDPLLRHMALVLQTTLEQENIAENFYTESLIDALAAHFLRRFHDVRHFPGQVPCVLPYKLRRTIAYIKAHLAQELSLVTLAAVEKTSPAHFARLFKYATGLAPHQYVIVCRIEEAKRLLAETEEALIAVGLQVGCADQSHFTALFHKHVGMTPKAYRDSLTH